MWAWAAITQGTDVHIVTVGEWVDVLELMGFSAGVGISVGLIRSIIETKDVTWTWWIPIQNIAASLLVAIFFALTIYDFDIGFKLKVGLTCVCAYVASDVLIGIKKIGSQIAADPILFLKTLKDMLFSRKAP